MPLMFSQLPGADAAIQSAAQEGWAAVLLVVIVVAVFAFTGWFLRMERSDARQREDRLANRITELETFIRTELVTELRRSSDVMAQVIVALAEVNKTSESVVSTLGQFTSILNHRPCMLPFDEQLAVRNAVKERREEEKT
jgi:hypothetical protein